MLSMERAMCNEAFINLAHNRADTLNDIISNRSLWLARAATAQYDIILHILVAESPLSEEETYMVSDCMQATQELFTREWVPYLRTNRSTPLENPANYDQYTRILLELSRPLKFICTGPITICSNDLYEKVKENRHVLGVHLFHISEAGNGSIPAGDGPSLSVQESIIRRLTPDHIARNCIDHYIHNELTCCPVSIQRILLARPELVQINDQLAHKIRKRIFGIIQRNPQIEQHIYKTYFCDIDPEYQICYALYLNCGVQDEVVDRILKYNTCCSYASICDITYACYYRLPNKKLLVSRENLRKLLCLFTVEQLWDLLEKIASARDVDRCHDIMVEIRKRTSS